MSALDAGEVKVPLLNKLAHDVVGPDLALEDLRRESIPIVMHPGRALFQPLPRRAHLAPLDLLGASDQLPLVYLLHVYPELLHPLLHVGDGGVHAHRPPADPAEGAARQGTYSSRSPDVGLHASEYSRIRDVAPGAAVGASDLVEAS
jgi:hypothetical protein